MPLGNVNGMDTTTDTRTMGELLHEYRTVLDRLAELAAKEKSLTEARALLETELKQRAESAGVNAFSSDEISVTITEALRAAYDPEKWNDIVKWAVDTGNMHVIQRRLTDAKLEQLLLDGVPFPDGLRLEPVTKLNHRKK